MLRPTCALTFELAGADANSDVAAAIKRSFAFIAPTHVVRATDPGALASKIYLEVRASHHALWDFGQPESDATWSQALMPWLTNKLSKLMGCVCECNNPQRASYFGGTHFNTLVIALAPCVFTFELEPDGSLRDVANTLDQLRAQVSKDGLGADRIRRIRIPSDATRAGADWVDIELDGGSAQRVYLS